MQYGLLHCYGTLIGRLQTNVPGRTPVSFTDPLVTARFNAPVFYKDVPRLVPFNSTLISITSSLSNKKMQIW